MEGFIKKGENPHSKGLLKLETEFKKTELDKIKDKDNRSKIKKIEENAKIDRVLRFVGSTSVLEIHSNTVIDDTVEFLNKNSTWSFFS